MITGMLKPHTFSLAVMLSLVGFGCVQNSGNSGDGSNADPTCDDASTPGCVISAKVARVVKPVVPASDGEALVAGNNGFALDLYGRIRATPGNLFYSPYSVSSALAMTYAGAHGDTEAQMAKAMHFTLPQAKLHPAFNGLDQQLASRGAGASGSDGGKFRLNIANALWGQSGFSFQAPFLTVLAESYGTGVHPLDFQKSPDPSRVAINDWVASKTEDRIKDLLPQGSITPDTRLVLTNAIYFNAAWQTPFDTKNTAPGAFTKQDGTSVTVPMMGANLDIRYGEGTGYAAVEIPYDGSQLSMLLALPTDLDAFEAGLDAAKLASILAALGTRSVDLKLPKFSFTAEQSLKKPLSDMGMAAAFTDEADFSGIDGKRDLSISAVLHKAFISVNEAGTEAAAATAGIVGATSVPEPAKITFDHPFIFFIRDNATRTLLFVGRVSDPTK
jgi:serpin B